MMPLDTSQASQSLQDSFLNSQGLDAVRAQGRDGDPQALRQVAEQFESMFIHQMLKQMRSTNQVLGKDNLLSSEQTKFHQQMLDQQMSLEMSSGRGMGLADQLYRHMVDAYGDHLNAPEAKNEPSSAARGDLRSGSSAAPQPAGKAAVTDSPESFVRAIEPHARRAAQELGVAPQALVAQTALETGWGQHVIRSGDGNNSHNLFNIKAGDDWQGERLDVSTLEYRDGLPRVERAEFRGYADYQSAFDDYVRLLEDNPRYRPALEAGGDAEAFVEQLQNAGYATDPAYADKLKNLMRSEPLAGLEPDGDIHSDRAL